jgi:hypothetical protein
MCQCRFLPSGRTIVCDACASRILRRINDLNEDGTHLAVFHQSLTQSMHSDMLTAINNWFDSLAQGVQ